MPRRKSETLTYPEEIALLLTAMGLDDKEIAQQLGVSPSAIKSRKGNARIRLGRNGKLRPNESIIFIAGIVYGLNIAYNVQRMGGVLEGQFIKVIYSIISQNNILIDEDLYNDPSVFQKEEFYNTYAGLFERIEGESEQDYTGRKVRIYNMIVQLMRSGVQKNNPSE